MVTPVVCSLVILLISVKRMVYKDYIKYRIHSRLGYMAPTIAKMLQKEGECFRRGISKFIARYKRNGTVLRKPGLGKWAKVTEEVKQLVEQKMRDDDETTAVQLHQYLYHGCKCRPIRLNHRCLNHLLTLLVGE